MRVNHQMAIFAGIARTGQNSSRPLLIGPYRAVPRFGWKKANDLFRWGFHFGRGTRARGDLYGLDCTREWLYPMGLCGHIQSED